MPVVRFTRLLLIVRDLLLVNLLVSLPLVNLVNLLVSLLLVNLLRDLLVIWDLLPSLLRDLLATGMIQPHYTELRLLRG